jgi:hypothetical protein
MDELAGFRMLAKGYLALSKSQIDKMLSDEKIEEIL